MGKIKHERMFTIDRTKILYINYSILPFAQQKQKLSPLFSILRNWKSRLLDLILQMKIAMYIIFCLIKFSTESWLLFH